MILTFESYVNDDDKIFFAIQENDFNTVKNLIDNGYDVNKKRNFNTPLMTAVSLNSERYDIIIYLIKHGADVNAIDNNNRSVLNWAVYVGDLKTIKLLIKYGANINIVDKYDDSLLNIAAIQSHFEILFYLLTLNNIEWYFLDKHNKFFIDYLSVKYKNKIKKLYPKKYMKYLIYKKSKKFNL